jgi:hypothetical protein
MSSGQIRRDGASKERGSVTPKPLGNDGSEQSAHGRHKTRDNSDGMPSRARDKHRYLSSRRWPRMI